MTFVIFLSFEALMWAIHKAVLNQQGKPVARL